MARPKPKPKSQRLKYVTGMMQTMKAELDSCAAESTEVWTVDEIWTQERADSLCALRHAAYELFKSANSLWLKLRDRRSSGVGDHG